MHIRKPVKLIIRFRGIIYDHSNPEEHLMERRIGSALILIEDKQEVAQLNQIISHHSDIIIGRQGLPLRDYGFNIISLILDGTSDQISSLTGQLGRLKSIQVKSVMLKPANNANDNS